jgi:hypothetical protein
MTTTNTARRTITVEIARLFNGEVRRITTHRVSTVAGLARVLASARSAGAGWSARIPDGTLCGQWALDNGGEITAYGELMYRGQIIA